MIPLAKPYICEEEKNAVLDVLNSGILSLGKKIIEFESAFKYYCKTSFAISVSSGTAGLDLCLKALNILEGDEVITSSFSFIASANCILFQKAKPVFVDIDNDYNIDVNLIEKAITKKTKAILPVHIFGIPCKMDKIMEIAKKHNLHVIEDACEALGTWYKGRHVGTYGDAGVFAFYANKQITTGEGGMIITNNQTISELTSQLRNQGRSTSSTWLEHEILGYNFRLNEMSSALGLEQMKKLTKILDKRHKILEFYYNELRNIKNISLGPLIPDKSISYFVLPIQIKNGKRNELIKKLAENGVQSKAYFSPPIHLQPVYKKFGYKEGDFPVTEKMSNEVVILPYFTSMNEEDITKVVFVLKQCLKSL